MAPSNTCIQGGGELESRLVLQSGFFFLQVYSIGIIRPFPLAQKSQLVQKIQNSQKIQNNQNNQNSQKIQNIQKIQNSQLVLLVLHYEHIPHNKIHNDSL
jgi:hypothetical protein